MSMGGLLRIQPSELKFPFEVRKQSVCALQLANNTKQYVAFKVKTTNPKRYCVKPNAGVVLPNSLCNVTVTVQAQKEAPPDMQCRDKFLVQSVSVPNGTTAKDINQEMFNNGEFVYEFKLRVVFVPANPPSPVPEEDEEGTSPGTSSAEDEIRKLETVVQSLKRTVRNAPDSEDCSIEKLTKHLRCMLHYRDFLFILETYDVAKLKDEKASITKQKEKLLGELDLMQKQTRRGGGSIVVLLFGLVIGIFIGYFIGE